MQADRILVVGHGDLPEALVASARMIAGALPAVAALGLAPGESPTTYAQRMREALAGDDAVLVLTDLRGGTPDNVANAVARRRAGTVVVANCSLPLLIEFALGGMDTADTDEHAELARATTTYSPR